MKKILFSLKQTLAIWWFMHFRMTENKASQYVEKRRKWK